jgi:hypothetical protein
MIELFLVHWHTILLALIPLVGVLLSRRKSSSIDFKQFAHFPQPEERDEKRGHWPWIEKSAALGDPRRSFGMFCTRLETWMMAISFHLPCQTICDLISTMKLVTINLLTPGFLVDIILYEQAQKLGFPPVLLVDWRPMEPFMILFILDNTVAEQVTKPSKQFSTSIPKHPAMQDLSPLVGSRSLVTLDVCALSSSRYHWMLT